MKVTVKTNETNLHNIVESMFTPDDAMYELIQNAYRAGATKITTSNTDDSLTIHDDGCGIQTQEQWESCVAKATSAWNEKLDTHNPAGIGLKHILQHHEVTIESGNKKLHTTPENYKPNAEFTIEALETPVQGTRITIHNIKNKLPEYILQVDYLKPYFHTNIHGESFQINENVDKPQNQTITTPYKKEIEFPPIKAEFEGKPFIISFDRKYWRLEDPRINLHGKLIAAPINKEFQTTFTIKPVIEIFGINAPEISAVLPARNQLRNTEYNNRFFQHVNNILDELYERIAKEIHLNQKGWPEIGEIDPEYIEATCTSNYAHEYYIQDKTEDLPTNNIRGIVIEKPERWEDYTHFIDNNAIHDEKVSNRIKLDLLSILHKESKIKLGVIETGDLDKKYLPEVKRTIEEKLINFNDIEIHTGETLKLHDLETDQVQISSSIGLTIKGVTYAVIRAIVIPNYKAPKHIWVTNPEFLENDNNNKENLLYESLKYDYIYNEDHEENDTYENFQKDYKNNIEQILNIWLDDPFSPILKSSFIKVLNAGSLTARKMLRERSTSVNIKHISFIRNQLTKFSVTLVNEEKTLRIVFDKSKSDKWTEIEKIR